VWSANERPGITDIAHLFEHMMFKGTPAIGTRDAKRDLEIIAEQERMRTECTPLGKFEESFDAMLCDAHPYIGRSSAGPPTSPAPSCRR
jgi:predicted Zn-dependent peptidase